MSCSSYLEMSRLDLGKLAGSPSDHGAGDAPNSSGDIEHARTRPSEGNPGRSGFGSEAWPRGRTPGPDGPADRAAGDSIPGVWRGGPDLAQAWRSWQPAAGCGVSSAGPDDHPGSLRRFRADTGVREAPGMPRHPARQGNGTAADDGSWFVDATPAAATEGLSATSTARLPPRSSPTRDRCRHRSCESARGISFFDCIGHTPCFPSSIPHLR
ncbi:putative integrase, catalytic region [Burkholderia thailandensis Phuket 4W-1]|nr:putative integrase, catalytic region [Burkholderia thailandensis E254]KIS56548.1 putative integrase, catalytic region [Burkholderia thailandensis Phuket 4W-1]